MITFGNVAQANANGIIVTIKGDGILASLKFAINKAPFNLVNICSRFCISRYSAARSYSNWRNHYCIT